MLVWHDVLPVIGIGKDLLLPHTFCIRKVIRCLFTQQSCQLCNNFSLSFFSTQRIGFCRKKAFQGIMSFFKIAMVMDLLGNANMTKDDTSIPLLPPKRFLIGYSKLNCLSHPGMGIFHLSGLLAYLSSFYFRGFLQQIECYVCCSGQYNMGKKATCMGRPGIDKGARSIS